MVSPLSVAGSKGNATPRPADAALMASPTAFETSRLLNHFRNPFKSDASVMGTSLCLFSPTNRFRVLVKKFVISKGFENFMLLIIVLSSIMLALDNPLNNPDSTLQRTVRATDTLFAVLFTVEFGLKVVAFSFMTGAYPRNRLCCVFDRPLERFAQRTDVSHSNSVLAPYVAACCAHCM